MLTSEQHIYKRCRIQRSAVAVMIIFKVTGGRLLRHSKFNNMQIIEVVWCTF